MSSLGVTQLFGISGRVAKVRRLAVVYISVLKKLRTPRGITRLMYSKRKPLRSLIGGQNGKYLRTAIDCGRSQPLLPHRSALLTRKGKKLLVKRRKGKRMA